MSFKYLSHSVKGMTLLESLVALAILSIALLGGFFMLNEVTAIQVRNEIILSTIDTRNSIFNLVTTKSGIPRQIKLQSGAGQPFECLSALSTPGSPLVRDCSLMSNYKLKIFDRGPDGTGVAVPIYDTNLASQGFNLKGEVCDQFSLTDPRPICPIKLDLQWQPQCPFGYVGCKYPLVKIIGIYQFSGYDKITALINLDRLKIEYLADVPICGNTPPAITWAYDNAYVSKDAQENYFSDLNGKVLTDFVQGAVLSTRIPPCFRSVFNFRDDVNSGAIGTGGSDYQDSENVMRVCVASTGAGNDCIFEYRRVYVLNAGLGVWEPHWKLFENNVEVFSSPASMAVNSFSNLKFSVRQGIVQFSFNNKTVFTFLKGMDDHFVFKMVPPSKSYSDQGVKMVSVTVE